MLQENCYIVSDETKQCVIIDCGAYYEEERKAIARYVSDNGLKPVHLLVTHGHLDHNFGNAFVEKEYGLKPEVSHADQRLMEHMEEQAQTFNVTLNEAMDMQYVIHTPLMWIDKCQTWALADRLGVLQLIREKTLTCYNGIQGDGCGHCPACKLRREGLERYLSLSEEEKRNLLPSFLMAGIQ